MIKNLVQFQCVINGKSGTFLLEPDTNVNDAKLMVFEFSKFISEVEKNAIAAQEAIKETPQVEDV